VTVAPVPVGCCLLPTAAIIFVVTNVSVAVEAAVVTLMPSALAAVATFAVVAVTDAGLLWVLLRLLCLLLWKLKLVLLLWLLQRLWQLLLLLLLWLLQML